MKISNMNNPRTGKPVANQYIISEEGRGANGNFISRETFQSYKTIIAIRTVWEDRTDVTLDRDSWDYSLTTGKYRNIFLGEDVEETRRKIADGTYRLENLNK